MEACRTQPRVPIRSLTLRPPGEARHLCLPSYCHAEELERQPDLFRPWRARTHSTEGARRTCGSSRQVFSWRRSWALPGSRQAIATWATACSNERMRRRTRANSLFERLAKPKPDHRPRRVLWRTCGDLADRKIRANYDGAFFNSGMLALAVPGYHFGADCARSINTIARTLPRPDLAAASVVDGHPSTIGKMGRRVN